MTRTRRLSVAIRVALLAVLVTVSLPLYSSDAAPHSPDDLKMPRYYHETGFWLQGPFRQYWETTGGLFVHGYPLTGIFLHGDGLYKQYFERAIFEWHPDLAGTPYEVLLQRLGAIRTADRMDEEPFIPLHGLGSDQFCNFYQETGHRLCFGFKNHWMDNGGLRNFGFPISEEFQELNPDTRNIHTVQYFERSRFEWHPEHRGTPYEVLLGRLGAEYMLDNPPPSGATQRQDPAFPPADPTSGMHYGPHVGYGFNVVWRGDAGSDAFHKQTMDKVNEAGFSWIRIQVQWRSVEPQPGHYRFDHIDRVVNVARQENVRIMASVLKAPTWATGDGTDGIPADPGSYGRMMEQLARHFAGRIDAYEIWNEQNLAFETSGFVRMDRYVGILRTGYNGVKAGDPNAIVVFGGLTPTGVNDPNIAIDDLTYMQQIYAYNNGEIKQYYDVLGVHPGSNNNPPDTMWPYNPGPGEWTTDESFYFRRAAQLRDVMVANGEGHKQVWLTEFGWSSSPVPAPGQEYAADNSELDQARYIVRAYEIAKAEWPWMGIMFLWNLNFSTLVEPGEEVVHWSVLNPDWSPRPAFDAVREMPK